MRSVSYLSQCVGDCRRWRSGLCILLFIGWMPALGVSPATGSSDVTYAPLPWVELGAGFWLSRGESAWQISFFELDDELGRLRGRSRLEWDSLDVFMLRVHGTLRVAPWMRVYASYGFGDVVGGRNTDTDWIGALDEPDNLQFRSVADTSGEVHMLDMRLAFRISEWINIGDGRGNWDIVFGYRQVEEDLRDRRGVMTVLDGERVRQPFPDLNSTYSFDWRSLLVGLEGEFELADRLRARGLVLILYGTQYRGEGFWNLRDDFRAEPPNFIHRASGGAGVELKLSVLYDITPNVFAEAGLWRFQMRNKDGTDRLFLADGEEATTSLDWVRTVRQGYFMSVGARF